MPRTKWYVASGLVRRSYYELGKVYSILLI